MQPAEIAKSYDSIAHLWLEPHLDRDGIRQHEHALQFRAKGGVALDVGCGCNGRFFRLLEGHGYQSEGLEISPQMIELAKKRNPDTMIHHADVCSWTPPKQYDFITAWDSIWHVPLDQNESVLRKLLGALTLGGSVHLDDGRSGRSRRKVGREHGAASLLQRPGYTENTPDDRGRRVRMPSSGI